MVTGARPHRRDWDRGELIGYRGSFCRGLRLSVDGNTSRRNGQGTAPPLPLTPPGGPRRIWVLPGTLRGRFRGVAPAPGPRAEPRPPSSRPDARTIPPRAPSSARRPPRARLPGRRGRSRRCSRTRGSGPGAVGARRVVPASRSRLAYSSPSSRSGSKPAVATYAGGPAPSSAADERRAPRVRRLRRGRPGSGCGTSAGLRASGRSPRRTAPASAAPSTGRPTGRTAAGTPARAPPSAAVIRATPAARFPPALSPPTAIRAGSAPSSPACSTANRNAASGVVDRRREPVLGREPVVDAEHADARLAREEPAEVVVGLEIADHEPAAVVVDEQRTRRPRRRPARTASLEAGRRRRRRSAPTRAPPRPSARRTSRRHG